MRMSYIYWYSVTYIPHTGTLSIGEDNIYIIIYYIPNISDPTNCCIIIACTVPVQRTATHACLTLTWCMLLAEKGPSSNVEA